MPALDRYTGVLFDALDAASLSTGGRDRATSEVVIHSALFGLLRADDLIPAYRLSHDSRLPGRPLAAHWRAAIGAELATMSGLLLDLRSEAYVALGPVPAAPERWFVRVVAESPDGTRRALNHFNKKGKGEFVRAVLESGADFADSAELFEWASVRGIRLRRGRPGELELTVDEAIPEASARGTLRPRS